MRQSIFQAVLQAAPLLLQASIVTAQTATGTGLKPVTTLSCYQSVDNLAEYQEYQYMTDGWCQEQCGSVLNKPVMAITGGSTCYCGDEIPAADQIVSNSSCNSPCNGFGTKNCGGIGFWQVYLTGLTTNVDVVANTTTSSSSSVGASSTTSASPSVITKAGETVIVTASSSPTATAQSTGSSKVGIAVGVVVGIIAIAGLVGALIFYLRQRRRRAIEDEHKRNAAISDFVTGKKSETSSSTDQRLDPVIFSHRRESIGSIADEMDYSRRILQVRNPDHRASQQSNLVP